MAAKCNDFTADLKQFVTCSICNDLLNEPKMMPCMHTFCLGCLEEWYQQCHRDKNPFQCPSCRSTICVDDVNKLRTSFQHNSLIELYNTIKENNTVDEQSQQLPCFSCSKTGVVVGFCFQCGGMLCTECYKAHSTMKSFKETHQAALWKEFNKETISNYIDCKSYCQEKYHEKFHLEYYCQDCKKTICQKCTATSHSLHEKISLEEASEQTQQSLRKEKQRLHKVIKMHENELKLSDANRERISNQFKVIDEKLCDEEKAKINVIQSQFNTQKAKLNEFLESQKTDNNEEKSEILDILEQARNLKDHCGTMENIDLKQFILNGHDKLEEVCQTAVKGTPILPTRPANRYTSLRYVPNHEAFEILQNLKIGEVEVSVTDPSRCTIESVHQARHGFENHFKIITRDTQENECYTDETLIDIQIQDIDGNDVHKEITNPQPGRYTVKYKARQLSPYTLMVTIGGTHVSNSPKDVHTKEVTTDLKPVKVLQTTETSCPTALAVSDKGLIAALNPSTAKATGSIVLYNTDGEFLQEFGGEGTAGEARLHDLKGLAFISDDQLLVSDNADEFGFIKLFDIIGNYQSRIIFRQKEMVFTGMCTANENIACLTHDNTTKQTLIKLYSKQPCQLLQDIKLDIGNFVLPGYVAYDDKKYYVTISTGIHVFNEINGALLITFGEEGDKEGQFRLPRGLAAFGSDMVLVCDMYNNRVQLISYDGCFITSFGSGLGRDMGPRDVAVTSDGQVFVLEWGGQQVRVFR